MAVLKVGANSYPLSVNLVLKIAELNSASAAQLFAAYCVAQGLEVNAVVQRPDFAELYAAAEQQSQVEQHLTLFLQQPGHPRYQAAAWQLSQPGASSAARSPVRAVSDAARRRAGTPRTACAMCRASAR